VSSSRRITPRPHPGRRASEPGRHPNLPMSGSTSNQSQTSAEPPSVRRVGGASKNAKRAAGAARAELLQYLPVASIPLNIGHAFISYVHEDSDDVDALCIFLEAAGIQVWRDRDQLWPGEEWKIQIRRAIQRDALAFIACFSENTAMRAKSYQNEELVLAVSEYRLRPPGRPWLFPVRFSDVDMPEFDLGAGKTLDALQRTDLFGAARESGLARLALSISRVIAPQQLSSNPAPPAKPSTSDIGKAAATRRTDHRHADEVSDDSTGVVAELSPTKQMKSLLRDPSKDIELDDYVTDLADSARRQCLDPVRFPTSADELRSTVPATRFVVNRVDQYWQIIRQLAEALATGCSWGTVDHDPLWSRVMRTIANTTPMEGGQTALLDLRAYPRVMVMYAGALGSVARGQYGSLRAITVDAKFRDQGTEVPVIGVSNPWMPFSQISFVASALAIQTDGTPAPDEDIEALRQGRKGARLSPISDDLHGRLREILRPAIRDDDDYDEIFDRVEVLLGVIAEDAASQQKAAGHYLPGGWTGRYTWRSRFVPGGIFGQIHNELLSQESSWPPLTAGLFGGSTERANEAFAAMQDTVDRARQRW
jgi:hypothetical protein